MTVFLSASVPVVDFLVRFWSSLSVYQSLCACTCTQKYYKKHSCLRIPLATHKMLTPHAHKIKVLNATLEDETLMAEFETLIANNDVQALSYEQFLAFARQVGREALARAYV